MKKAPEQRVEKKKQEFFLKRWFGRLFNRKKTELSFMEEEALQSPFKMIVNNFWDNKLSRFGLIMFILIFLGVMFGPYLSPIDLGFQDNTQVNVPPGLNMMSPPKELLEDLKKIEPGNTFGVGLSNAGDVYIWGHTKVTGQIDLAEIPEEVKEAKIEDIVVGSDHILAIDDQGMFHTWGNTRLRQDRYPQEFQKAMKKGEKIELKSIAAGTQFTVAVTEDGTLYTWGNSNLNDIKLKREYADMKFQKVTANINNFIALSEDGAVVYPARKKNPLSRIPEGLDSGVVDIASTAFTNAALKEDGTIVVWGNRTRGEGDVPEHEGKIIKIGGGRAHYTALTDQGELLSWGSNNYGQTFAPEMDHSKIDKLFVGYYQNYAVSPDGDLKTWGLKGHILGTDEYGRDLLTRIINGGQVTMTVGAVSVLISLVIGVVLGGIAGYFGGWVDMVVMRIAEIVGGLPFLPFALILSAIIGTRISVEQRMYLIMVVLGVLSWPGLARLVRAQIFATREMEFVTAAKAMGLRETAIVFKHIIPNVISVILVSATLSFATSMLTESTLSYLGFGIAPPTPTWGNMLKSANDSIVIQQYWWRWVFPSLVFSICTICINLIGDGLRDAIDPKSNER